MIGYLFVSLQSRSAASGFILSEAIRYNAASHLISSLQ